MIDINELRRLAQHHDDMITMAPIKPATLFKLLDRLEAAEKARDFAKEEVERLLALAHDQNNELIRLREEGRTLRAKIEQMEKQGPVRHEFQGRDGSWHPFIDQRHYENTVADGTWPIRALYTIPGAKGEEE